jgi:hypothetical protein
MKMTKKSPVMFTVELVVPSSMLGLEIVGGLEASPR